MATFGELKPNVYYLIQVDEESDIEIVSVILRTSETVLLRSYLPASEDFFQYHGTPVFKLIEEFDEELAFKFESLYESQETEEYEEEEE